MAPCFISKADFIAPGLVINPTQLQLLRGALDIFSIESLFGPEWDDDIDTICVMGYLFGFGDVCDLLNQMELYSESNPGG